MQQATLGTQAWRAGKEALQVECSLLSKFSIMTNFRREVGKFGESLDGRPPREVREQRPKSERRPDNKGQGELRPRRVSSSPVQAPKSSVPDGDRPRRRFEDDNLYRVTDKSIYSHCVKVVKKILHEGKHDFVRLKSSSKVGS